MRYLNTFWISFIFLGYCHAGIKDLRKRISPTDTARIMNAFRKSRAYAQSAPSLSYQVARTALADARQSGFRIGEARLLRQIASLNEQFHSIHQARFYQQQSVGILEKIAANSAELASGYLYLGALEVQIKNNRTALKDLENAHAIYIKLNNRKGIFSYYSALGHLYERLGDEKSALHHYLKAKEIGKSDPATPDYLMLLEHLGSIYFKMDSSNKALLIFQEGIDKSQGDTVHLLHHLNFLRQSGKVYHMMGNTQKAVAYHKQALSIASSQGKLHEQARSLIELANTLKSTNSDQSLLHLNRALSIARQIGNKKLAAEIYRTLSEIYSQQNRFKNALLALEAHHELLDSLMFINKVHEAAIIKGNYELQSSKINIQRLELVNERKTIERNAGAVVIVLTLVSLLFMGYQFYLTRKLNRKLYISNRVKDKLFSVIGHDLRNPIGGITTMLALMERKPLDAKILKNLSAMKKQGETALEVLSSLLKWGHSQLQGIKVNKRSFLVTQVLSKNTNLLAVQAQAKGITFHNNLPEDLILYADEDHLDFVIRNLLSNAIKFSFPSGSIEIDFKRAENGHIVIVVKDAGIGMSQEQIRQFNNGSLESSYGTNGEKGTGIGLMLSREYVKANGGKLWVESEIENGAAFYFSLSGNGAAEWSGGNH